MRALVISDTHFGAWTGEDILREPENLALLEPHLDVDELIFLGDFFDFLFASEREAFAAAEPLLEMLRERLQGKRLVFIPGNHDHHLVARAAQQRLEVELATGSSADPALMRERDFFRRFLDRRLEGVQIDIHYPTYTFAGVLCTHGHYLDIHARPQGSTPDRLLSKAVWSIAIGGKRHIPSIDDYEATITLLSEVLYTIAQLPNGTHAQRQAFAAFQRLEQALHTGTLPLRAAERVAAWLGHQVGGLAYHGDRGHRTVSFHYEQARAQELERKRRTGAPTGGEAASFALARRTRPSDPADRSLQAFEQAVMNLGWAFETDRIVFAHTHQPLEGALGPSGSVRYWNSGSWIYEPDLSSREAFVAYLQNAWPGTAVLIDSDQINPRLLRLREHLNPLHRATGDTLDREGDRSPRPTFV